MVIFHRNRLWLVQQERLSRLLSVLKAIFLKRWVRRLSFDTSFPYAAAVKKCHPSSFFSLWLISSYTLEGLMIFAGEL